MGGCERGGSRGKNAVSNVGVTLLSMLASLTTVPNRTHS